MKWESQQLRVCYTRINNFALPFSFPLRLSILFVRARGVWVVSPQRIVASGEKSIGPLIIHPEMNDRNTLAYQSITTRLLSERADTDREGKQQQERSPIRSSSTLKNLPLAMSEQHLLPLLS